MITAVNTSPTDRLASRIVNGILSIKPLANLAKHQARNMMIKRAEKMGVPWRKQVEELRKLDWETQLAQVNNPQLTYPDYYLCSFHAYEHGNLNWEAAWEVESAAYAVHAKIWDSAGIQGDPKLRQSYHDLLKEQVTIEPQNILDLGCSCGHEYLFPATDLSSGKNYWCGFVSLLFSCSTISCPGTKCSN